MLSQETVATYADDVVQKTRHVVQTFGPRDPGSPGERAAHAYMAEQLEPYCDRVETESFDVHPMAFMGSIPVAAALLALSILGYWYLPVAGLAVALLAAFVGAAELGLYWRLLEPLFPRRQSQNVIGIRQARRQRKRILLMGGHCDAAYEWRYNRHSAVLLKSVAGGGVLLVLFAVGAHTVNAAVNFATPVVDGTPMATLGWLLLGSLPFVLLVSRYSNFSVVSPGANDNLSGCFTAVALARYLEEEGVVLENTELRFLNSGSEEAGLRGAKAYAARHHEELSTTPSCYVALETFRDLDHLKIYNRDLHGAVKHDAHACAWLADAAEKVGHPLGYGTISVGASDAAAFTQAGLSATALAAMDPSPPRYYHTRADVADDMNPECIGVALRILVEAIRTFDTEDLAG